MIEKWLVSEIHDLLIRLYGEGLKKQEKEDYEKLSISELEDLRLRLMLKLL